MFWDGVSIESILSHEPGKDFIGATVLGQVVLGEDFVVCSLCQTVNKGKEVIVCPRFYGLSEEIGNAGGLHNRTISLSVPC